MTRLWDLAPSPNNLKARMALRFKGVEFDTRPVDPADRAPVREISGQDLTPVLESHGAVIVDSEAILQFADANWRDAPRLFPAHRDGRRACEAWHRKTDAELAAHWLPTFFFAIKRRDTPDPDSLVRFHEALAAYDAELGGRDSFHDDPEMAVCDLRVAEWASYALPGERLLERAPLFERFRELYAVEPGRYANLERFLRPWDERAG